MNEPIVVEGLEKNYGAVAAVKGIGFSVKEGEVFGLLGPNGAGKTTTVEILEGLRTRSRGSVSVLGYDPEVQTAEVKDRIGVCLQATNLQDKLKVKEAVELFAAFYTRTVNCARLLERLQLREKRDAWYSQLSGGQKQRLALALALLNDPQVLFLDEPSAGLDPQARLEVHELVGRLRRERRTILLTTHYIEEAEKLCDRVAIIDEGRIVAIGTPREIQASCATLSTVEIRCARPLPDGVPRWEGVEKAALSEDGAGLKLWARSPARTVSELVKWIDCRGLELQDIRIGRPTLEDAFIELTGKSLRE